MALYGYSWNQSTVTRTETAERPLRLNEVVHLAAIFKVPVTQFLLSVDMTLGEIDEEIERTTRRRDELAKEVERLSGFVKATASELKRQQGVLGPFADQLELVNNHLEIIRGLRAILERGQEAAQ